MRTLFVAIIFGLLFIPNNGRAADLISIIVVDTLDYTVGRTVENDYANMDYFLSKVSRNTNLKRKEIVCKGYSVVACDVLDKINSLEVDPQDVVVFYFSGHGYRTTSKKNNPWPYLYFSLYHEGIDYEHVLNILQEKNPRLLIVIADACNNYISENGAPIVVEAARSGRKIKGKTIDNYNNLFMKTSGSLFITSSKSGHRSYATMEGGFYTNSFLISFYEEVENSNAADWESIIERAAFQIVSLQVPFHVMEMTNL